MSNKLLAQSLNFIFFVVMQTEYLSSNQLAGFLRDAKRKATLRLSHHFSLCLFSAFVFFFCFRRLGVELGKSVVYQEPNRGEAGILLSLTWLKWLIMCYFFKTLTHNDHWRWCCCQRPEWRWKSRSVDKTSSSFRPSRGMWGLFNVSISVEIRIWRPFLQLDNTSCKNKLTFL